MPDPCAPTGSMIPSVHVVAVIGAGVRGRAFALRCLRAGFRVVLEDVLSSNLRRATEELEETALPGRERLQLASSVEDAVREADLAIDFVPDELESKLEILSMMDRMAPPRTIFCTPTALSLADLASCTYRPTRCLALRPSLKEHDAQAELLHTSETDAMVLAAVEQWLGRIGMGVEASLEAVQPLTQVS